MLLNQDNFFLIELKMTTIHFQGIKVTIHHIHVTWCHFSLCCVYTCTAAGETVCTRAKDVVFLQAVLLSAGIKTPGILGGLQLEKFNEDIPTSDVGSVERYRYLSSAAGGVAE